MQASRRFSLDPSWQQAATSPIDKKNGTESLEERVEALNLKQKAASHPNSHSRSGSLTSLLTPRSRLKASLPLTAIEDHINRVMDILNGVDPIGKVGLQRLLEEFNVMLTSGKKPLEHAAEDLWRICPKMEIMVQEGNTVKTIQAVDSEAYNPNLPANIADQNARFLRLLSLFQEDFQLPEHVEWANQEQVREAVKTWKLQSHHRLARFLRTCDQKRFHADILTSTYGSVPDGDEPPPIFARVTTEKYLTRSFNANGTHSETLTLPIDLFDRTNSSEIIAKVNWVLTFQYDADCYLKALKSSCIKSMPVPRMG